ncbi:MAG: hypothetical protein CMJ84_02875 [Planctomycetes bacterium]|nr:hypothetical protein [Planctomycetota bacterium]
MVLVCAGAPIRAQQPEDRHPDVDRGAVARAVDEYVSVTGVEAARASWEGVRDRLTFFGDLRLRHESSFELADAPDRHRQRMRWRIGANYELGESLLAGARIASGSVDDPNSPHTTFGDALDGVELGLDRAFVTWRPERVEDAWVTAGKFGHDFYANPVYSELVWDGDVQPEGLLAGLRRTDVGPLRDLTLRAGKYLLLEQGAGSDASVVVAQLACGFDFGADWAGTAALGYYGYDDVTPDGGTGLLDDNSGNATVDEDGEAVDFESGFAVWNPILGLTRTSGGRPLSVAAEWMHNARAENEADSGWALGAAWGQAREKGDVRLYYQWQVLERDAIFSPFAQDDFLFATNHRSHAIGMNYQLADGIGLHLWALVSAPEEAGGDDEERWRVRLDLNIKF